MFYKMMLYFKLQIKLLIILLSVCLPPYLASIYLLEKPVPNIHYLFIILLFVFKILFFQDGPYRARMRNVAKDQLQKELKKNPSNTLIYQRLTDMINARDAMLILTGLIIVIIAITSGTI
jgi:hypothetical protein